MADLTREQIEQVYSNFEKVIDCSPVHEGKAEARKCLRMVTDLALSALDAQGGDTPEQMAQKYIAAEIDRSPLVAKRLGQFLARVLDEDDFKTADAMLLGLIEQIPSPAAVQALREVLRDEVISQGMRDRLEALLEE